jgi:hypothetical protein
MNPQEFYKVAQGIVSGSPPPGPALCRTAIGRAYFAALNVAVETLASLDVSCGGGAQKHGRTVRYLYASDDEHLKTALVAIDNLRTERNIVDYQMDRSDTEKVVKARKAVEAAKKVIDLLDKFESDLSRKNAALKSIEIYKSEVGGG